MLLENPHPRSGKIRFASPLTAHSLNPCCMAHLSAPTYGPTGGAPVPPDWSQCCCLLLSVGILQGVGQRGGRAKGYHCCKRSESWGALLLIQTKCFMPWSFCSRWLWLSAAAAAHWPAAGMSHGAALVSPVEI